MQPKGKRLTDSPSVAQTPFTEGWQCSRQEREEREIRESERKSLRLKADVTLGSVTTDQNPLKAIDHFHYSSHVSHFVTVYQTQRVCLHSTHTHTYTQRVHTLKHTLIRIQSKKSERTSLKKSDATCDPSQLRLNIYTVRGVAQWLTANKYLRLYGKTVLSPVQ